MKKEMELEKYILFETRDRIIATEGYTSPGRGGGGGGVGGKDVCWRI